MQDETATVGTPAEERLRPGHALVVMNPKSGSAAPELLRTVLQEVLLPAGWTWDLHETTGDGRDLAQAIDEAREKGCDLVIAAGGDGTIALVADTVAGCGIPVGIVPLGTGNVLSLELGIPADLRQALQVIVGPHRVREIDAMRVGRRHFALQIGIGLDSLMIRDTDPAAKRRIGRLAYMLTLARKLVGYRAKRFEVVVDGRRHRVRAWEVLVANSGVLGSPRFRWGPHIEPDDGQLDLVVANVRRPVDYLRLGWRLLLGRHGADPSLRYYRIKQKVEINSRSKLPVQADGEIIGRTPVRIEIVPRAVRVVVPATPPAEPPIVQATPQQVRRAERARQRLAPWLGPVGLLDTKVFLLVSRLPHLGPVDEAMKLLAVAMNRADGLVGLLAANALRVGKLGWAVLADVVPPLQLTNATVELGLKRIFARPRPFETVVAARVVGKKPSGYSFPSGHSAAAFAGAFLISTRFPRLRSALYSFAILMAFSRMYLRVHYLSDVVVGAASGAALAAGYQWVLRKAIRALRR